MHKIRPTKHARTGLTEEERREKIRTGLLKKKECDAKALKAVERLLDPVDPEWFREVVSRTITNSFSSCPRLTDAIFQSFFLNPGYYADVIDERSCIHVCGYPLCDKRVDSSGTKKFAISTRENKVFDITERKKFCSNLCFKRSNFYMDQLLTSPLWLRDEDDKKKRVLFYDEVDQKSKTSGKGEEVQFFKAKDVDDPKVETREERRPDEDLTKRMESLKVAPVRGSIARKIPRENGGKFSLDKVKRSMVKWFTIDTFRLVKGDGYVRQVLLENNCSVENVMSAVGDENLQGTFEFRSRYVELCRRLDLRELEDKNADKAELEEKFGVSESRGDATNPYEKIREEVEVNRMKIESFLQGKTEFDQEVRLNKNKECRVAGVRESESSDVEPRIPLVDRVAQNSLRRRIVSEQLDRT